MRLATWRNARQTVSGARRRRSASLKTRCARRSWSCSLRSPSAGASLSAASHSVGGVATLAADPLFADGAIAGVVCLGYPFHPAGNSQSLRTAHLEHLTCPTLIVQGTRDPLGTRDDAAGYTLSGAIKLHWLDDGDHDLKPRVRSGHTHDGHIAAAADAIAAFATARAVA
ncbi:MAG: alpha/beta family hydrolase [Pseudomonadota bacterium]